MGQAKPRQTTVGAAVAGELRALGATGSVEGRAALRVAALIDDAEQSTAAALSRELRLLMTGLREAAPAAAADPVDELRSKRERRRAG